MARFVPSDYSLDLFALSPGENWNSDDRRTFDQRLIDSGQGYTIVFNGGFMETVASPFMQMVDPVAGTLSFWGDGTTPFDLTSMDDTAAYLAEIVCDPALEQGYVELERRKAQGCNPLAVLPLMYQLPMASGRARLAPVDNDRYSQIAPTRLVDVLRNQHHDTKG